jgi:hypothetical protein
VTPPPFAGLPCFAHLASRLGLPSVLRRRCWRGALSRTWFGCRVLRGRDRPETLNAGYVGLAVLGPTGRLLRQDLATYQEEHSQPTDRVREVTPRPLPSIVASFVQADQKDLNRRWKYEHVVMRLHCGSPTSQRQRRHLPRNPCSAALTPHGYQGRLARRVVSKHASMSCLSIRTKLAYRTTASGL